MDFSIDVMNEIDIFQATQASRQRLVFPYITIDGLAQTVEAEGVPVQLTSSEFKILYLLACSTEATLSAKEIYRLVWQMEDLGQTNTVTVHISRLRNKLREACPKYEFIICRWKKGYQFISN